MGEYMTQQSSLSPSDSAGATHSGNFSEAGGSQLEGQESRLAALGTYFHRNGTWAGRRKEHSSADG
jgi:hypothetical protein